MSREHVKEIADRDTDFSQWYLDVVLKAELADYAPVRGAMVFRPYGYRIWELLQQELDRRFKDTGVVNAYFPLFIPEEIFKKEAEHIEGFAPEVPWVTHVGNEKLSERYVVRPTSETMFGTMYAKWIQSYRDLPLLINQWCSVVRWEKRTLPFMRTTEFLWQEGHTAHRDEEDARSRTMQMLYVYRDFLAEVLAIPTIAGRKTENEKFAGAVDTYSVEALMGDGRALQSATSHYLGDGFAKVLNIQFLDRDGRHKYVHTTSWGLSWRVIGAIIMVHGDRHGLVLPPAVAPYQVVVVPIAPSDDAREQVLQAVNKLVDKMPSAVRVFVDDRWEYTPGWKFNEWELRGVPIRLEVGPRDLERGEAVLVRRDTGEKTPVQWDKVPTVINEQLTAIQNDMLERARRSLIERTRTVADFEEFEQVIRNKRGFIVANWCGDGSCELQIKEKTGATIRCIPLEGSEATGPCIHCGRDGVSRVYFARAY